MLTPTASSAHARNSPSCTQLKDIIAKILPRLDAVHILTSKYTGNSKTIDCLGCLSCLGFLGFS